MKWRYWVRAVKCQLLAASLFVMLLGLSVSILTIVTYRGKHFTVINDVSLDTNSSYRTLHTIVFYTGICLSIILTIAALVGIVGTVRELESAMAVGFFCFAVMFCASVEAAYWTITNSNVVEDAVMDTYDFVYEDVRNNSSDIRRQELHNIHKTFLCCGKKSPFGEVGSIEKEFCPSAMEGTKEDCLQEIQRFLKKHMAFVSLLMTITIFFMVYGMILTSFLWYAIHFKDNLDRKGKYILARQQKRFPISSQEEQLQLSRP
ncbi:tetraspanin-32 isoform X1 [Varanus komodoensis]|uniref:Tetraspanin n=1 Tax=Varanus komodoensis TaxID=61221 RepID=A0A8D2IX79_VARKO|nr:tetraspanin-32 isoform X1 [Varanus komodoensis]